MGHRLRKDCEQNPSAAEAALINVSCGTAKAVP
jgi:hypothetical protein